jgi:adenosine deaminase
MTLEKKPTADQIKRIPKAVLHDHLDGGLRPQTVIDLAQEIGYTKLPHHEASALAEWFYEACNSGSLERYLETFEHTIAVMQTPAAVMRVAREAALDLARDGVVYAEVRGAPELFTRGAMNLDEVIEATTEGFQLGIKDALDEGLNIRVEQILCALRQNDWSDEVARKVVKYRNNHVVGFDIAGPEDGYPAKNYLSAFEYLKGENAHFTIHAGEAYGPASIWQAISICGAERLGHGVRIVEDIDFSAATPKLGLLAAYVRDRRIPLELCPTSNLQTGAVKDYASHPIGILEELRFRITINTDNRLMSGTSMSQEMEHVVKALDWTLLDLQRVTVNALKSAFIPFDERLAIIEEQVKPAYQKISEELN